jgi:hypothetical protein
VTPLIDPGAQGVHDEEPRALYCPAAHSTQAVRPSLEANEPGKHNAQDPEGVTPLLDPGAQGVHDEEPRALYCPAAHGKQAVRPAFEA